MREDGREAQPEEAAVAEEPDRPPDVDRACGSVQLHEVATRPYGNVKNQFSINSSPEISEVTVSGKFRQQN